MVISAHFDNVRWCGRNPCALAGYNWQGRGSQSGQDVWIAQHFSYKRNGIFIDIGANEGAMGRYRFSRLFHACFASDEASHCRVTCSMLQQLPAARKVPELARHMRGAGRA
jgi:hypothetical protein